MKPSRTRRASGVFVLPTVVALLAGSAVASAQTEEPTTTTTPTVPPTEPPAEPPVDETPDPTVPTVPEPTIPADTSTTVPDETEPTAPTTTVVDETEPTGPTTTVVDETEPTTATTTTTLPDETDPTVPTTATTTTTTTTVPDSTVPATTTTTTTIPAEVETSVSTTTTVPNSNLPEPVDPPSTTSPEVLPEPVVDPAADDLDVVGPSEPEFIDELRITGYEGIYADGVPVGVAMAASRHLESRGNYLAEAKGSTASGAYQIIDSTWNGYAGYARAVDAPPAVQDRFAYESFTAILKANGGDVSAIPIAWYYPKALSDPALLDTIPAPGAGNTLTIRAYQRIWMSTFQRLLNHGTPVVLPADTAPLIPAIAFPVLGPVKFVNDWHYARDGGARVHEGLDFMGSYGQPLRAAVDGEIVRIVTRNNGISGVSIEIRRADGLRAIYRHMNNDTPGTTDDAAIDAFRVHPDLAVGTAVRAGQIIGFMGDTGNAVGNPHLHFELRTDDRTPFAPYPAVIEAQQREQCSVGIGPWSTQFTSPDADAARTEALLEMSTRQLDAVDVAELAELDPLQLLSLRALSRDRRLAIREYTEPVPFLLEGDNDARWTISADGSVTAAGAAALITPNVDDCTDRPDPELMFGTDAAGAGVDIVAYLWWGDVPEDTPMWLSVRARDAIESTFAAEDESFERDEDESVTADEQSSIDDGRSFAQDEVVVVVPLNTVAPGTDIADSIADAGLVPDSAAD